MTPQFFKLRLKEIQDKYPLSFILPPIAGTIHHVDNDDNILFSELIGNPDLHTYEAQAKEAHETSLLIKNLNNTNQSPIFDISDMD